MPITLLTTGNWTETQLHVCSSADTRQRIPHIEDLIDEAWQSAIARRGIHLFDGPMCRLESWHADADSLRLSLSHTSYKVFFGTNLLHPHLADAYGAAVLANPLGLSAALVTSDGYLMLGRRNGAVAYYPNRVHPFAGALEPKDGDDLFAAIRRELAEELHLTADDLSEIRCIGLVEDPALRQPEAVFRLTTRLSRAQIERQVDAVEHDASWAIPATREAIEAAAADPDLTPVAAGALRLWENSRDKGTVG